jgi:hypothetical protein
MIAAAAEYARRLRQDPAAALDDAARLEEGLRRVGVTFAGETMRSFLRPHLVERGAWQALRADARRLLELAARLARSVFEGDAARLCAYLGLPEREARWIVADPGPPDVLLSRIDAFLTPAGPRFVEVNSDAPAGFGYGDRMAEVFAGLAGFRAFARDVPVHYTPSAPPLVAAVREAWRASGGGGAPVVAIVDWSDVKTRADQEILREAFEARGVRCRLADPRELERRAGRLFAGGEAIDVVYRRALLSELAAREADSAVLLESYARREALFVNSFRCQLSEDKIFLSILTDEAFATLLTEEERAFVAAAVPWTRKLEERRTLRSGASIDLVPHVIEQRAGLVLKPAHAYGGQSVMLGAETEPAAWERAVREATGGAWVVQERVAIPEEEFPVVEDGRLSFEALKLNANPFYVAGAEAGGIARVSRSAVINVSAGGGSVPSFVVG